MIKQTMYCDRCGKQVERVRDNQGFRLFKRTKYYVRKAGDYQVDLCQSCYCDLAKWFKEKKSERTAL